LKDPEGAKEYGLTIPNGMLLFGPPGCGKTYISEKLAEEVNFNYYFIKSSDLVSPYAFETQKKIGKLFDDAYKNKPSIICFDEFDSYAFRKDISDNAIMTGVVNEILTQLNNCGKRGVFVIATTNNPELIEKSILRKGRMDLLIYVPPPDYEARKELFKLYLKDKPKDFNINYDELANLTDKYVASDIEFIAIDAAREAYKFKTNITQKILINIIGRTRSSLSDEDNKKYDFYKDFFNGSTINTNYRKPIGFRINKDD
ncbi:MAG TPA: ATP-binding protein, partial [Candidatus Syntrophosphaera thermopropionivorans]|nr:ATP-binding protein [Candidatus Syntrophosphaera thermopropionivorans]